MWRVTRIGFGSQRILKVALGSALIWLWCVFRLSARLFAMCRSRVYFTERKYDRPLRSHASLSRPSSDLRCGGIGPVCRGIRAGTDGSDLRQRAILFLQPIDCGNACSDQPDRRLQLRGVLYPGGVSDLWINWTRAQVADAQAWDLPQWHWGHGSGVGWADRTCDSRWLASDLRLGKASTRVGT